MIWHSYIVTRFLTDASSIVKMDELYFIKKLIYILVIIQNKYDMYYHQMSDIYNFDENTTQIFLPLRQMTYISFEMCRLTKLQKMLLYSNKIYRIPSDIQYLTNLQILHLSDNCIQNIPIELCQLNNLKTLVLSFNEITEIPSEINQMTGLHNLYLYNNKIKQIPTELCQLVNLQELHLYNNQITEIPKEISQLVNLKGFFIYNNKITKIPFQMIHMKRLYFFNYGGNPIKNPNNPIIQRSFINKNKYNDSQMIGKDIKDSIFELLQNLKDDSDIVFKNDNMLSDQTKKNVFAYSIDLPIHPVFGCTFKDVLNAVLLEIQLFDLDKQYEMKRCLNNQINHMHQLSYTERLVKLISCLNGFSNKIIIM